jgi:'Cold-shock' DNA-binding domain
LGKINALSKYNSEHLSVPQQGIDKFLNGEGGYGFIKSDSGGRDIFVN